MTPDPRVRPGCVHFGQGELVEAYAAGALEDGERERFRAHLAACPRCRADLDAYADALAGLPLALAAAAPPTVPAGLRERILRAAAEGMPSAPPRSLAPPPGRPWPRGALKWASRAIALPAAAILALAAGWSVQQGVALARERAQLRAEQAALIGQQEIVLEVVDGRNTVRRLLAPPGGGASGAPGGAPYGKLFTRPDLPHVVAMAGRLPPPPPGQAYHLWVTLPESGGQARLAGVLTFNQGFGLLVFDAEGPGPAYDAAWITVQAPGSGAPTGQTVLRWPIP